MRVIRPALISYCFVAGNPGADSSADIERYLRAVWQGWAKLGCSNAIPGADVSPDFQRPTTGSQTRAVRLEAAAQGSHGGDVRQAFLFTKDDVVGVLGCIGSNAIGETLEEWTRVYSSWRAAVIPATRPRGVLGEAALLIGATSERQPEVLDAAVAPTLAQLVESRTRPSRSMLGDYGVLWEVGSDDTFRLFGALAPPEHEADLERWVWWDPSLGFFDLVPFARYLLQSGKLRYEVAVYDRDATAFRRTRDEVDEAIAQVVSIEQSADAASRDDKLAALLTAQSQLSRAQARSAGLLFSMSRLRELRETLRIAAANLRALIPAGALGATSLSPPFADDVHRAEQTVRQIDHDLAYAEAVRERAQEVHALTALRVQQAREEQAHVLNRLTLLQSSILGALLATLAAIGAFGVDVPLDKPLEAPVIATVFGLALALPTLLVGWREPYRPTDYVAFGILGAFASWLLLKAAWRDAGAEAVTITLAVGALAFPALIRALQRSRATGT